MPAKTLVKTDQKLKGIPHLLLAMHKLLKPPGRRNAS